MDEQPLRLAPSPPPSPRKKARRTNRDIGNEMEAAVARACAEYTTAGRCIVERCYPPFIHLPGVGPRPGRKQGSDLSGCHAGGQAIYLEAKSCAERLELRDGPGHLSDTQRAFLLARVRFGADVRLIVHFDSTNETYALPILPDGALEAFLSVPWRKSITVDMARAWGLLIPDGRDATGAVDKDGRPKKARFIRWLDGRPHRLTAEAIEAVARDEKRAASALEF